MSEWENHTVIPWEICAKTAEIAEHEYVIQRSTTKWERSVDVNARFALGLKKRPAKEAVVWHVGIIATEHMTSRV